MYATLFDHLPEFPPSLPDDELAFLAGLPVWPTEQLLTCDEWAIAQRLARKGLVKTSRCHGELCAGKTVAATIRQAR